MNSEKQNKKIWSLVSQIGVGMLATVDGDEIRSRPMQIVQNQYEGVLWFFTRKSAEKCFEVRDENHVCVSFCDHLEGIYVSLSGRARLSQDRELIEKLWTPAVESLFVGGKSDPEIALLEISVDMSEYWRSEEGEGVPAYRPQKANFFEERIDLGENRKFG